MRRKGLLWLLAALLLLPAAGLRAQEAASGEGRSDRLFRWLQQGRGDSLYAAADSTLRSRTAPVLLGAMYRQLEAVGGSLRQAGPWSVQTAGALTVEERRLDFERTALTLRFVYDAAGRLAGFFALPAASVAPADTAGCIERDTVVVCGRVRLPATLCLPARRTGRVPLVVFVHGSGPNDRDETLGPNKLFRSMAHALARAGVASLRYDKRTYVYRGARFVEVSGRTDYDTETVDDAVAALALARTLPEAAPDSLYVVGHSLGAALAPRVAARAAVPPAGIVLLAAPARPFEESLGEQLRYIARLQGTAPSRADSTARSMTAALPPEYVAMARRYDAVATARTLSLPILVVQGSHDYQVTAADFGRWWTVLRDRPAVRFAWLPGLDHLMRPLPAMARPDDYARYVALSPDAVQAVLRFVRGR